MRLAIICLGLAVMPLVSASAQTGSAESVKAAVQAFVRSYTEAANRADVSSYVGMYQESPDLITISSGEVTNRAVPGQFGRGRWQDSLTAGRFDGPWL